jgi:hypothetical protein
MRPPLSLKVTSPHPGGKTDEDPTDLGLCLRMLDVGIILYPLDQVPPHTNIHNGKLRQTHMHTHARAHVPTQNNSMASVW